MQNLEATAAPGTFDGAKAEAFAGRVVGMLNDAALTLMTSIGHQVGLFDTMSELSPSTSQQIADAAGLNARYVREWLGAMTAGRIVEYDPAARTYTLPPEHAACLTRAAGIDNLATQTQFVPLLAEVEQAIIRCFREGGGVPYSEFPRFQQLMAEDSANVHDAALLETILPLVPGLPERLERGVDVLDVGCGSGHAINLMARAYPRSRFTGYDFSEAGIEAGRREAEEWGLENARHEVTDVSRLDEPGRYDLITAFDAIHDQARPDRVLAGIAQALRDDGVFLMVDIAASSRLEENVDHLLGPFLYSVSTMHCMTVSLALDGAGLGTCWGEQKAREMLSEAGFARVEVERVEGDLLNNYYMAYKG